jgi:hypothetical protein
MDKELFNMEEMPESYEKSDNLRRDSLITAVMSHKERSHSLAKPVQLPTQIIA